MKKANLLIYTILIILLIVMVNYLSYRHYSRIDTTQNKIFSLSDKTKKVIKKINSDLKITVFIPASSKIYGVDIILGYIREMLAEYSKQNKFISISYIDQIQNQIKVKYLVEKYKITSDETIVFEYKDNFKYVNYSDLVELEQTYGRTPRIKFFKGEQKFTSAILSLIYDKKDIIYFTKGHKELDIMSQEADGGLSLNEYLKYSNFKSENLDLSLIKKIPEDCSVLVVAKPELDFLDREILLIKKYVKTGGKLIILLESNILKNQKKLFNFIEKYNIKPENAITIDPINKLPMADLSYLVINNYGYSLITQDLNKDRVNSLFVLPIPLTKTKSDSNFIYTSLLKTSDDSWGEKSLNKLDNIEYNKNVDIKGPLSIGWLIENKNDSSKIIIIGDADFVNNTNLNNLGNTTLITNIFNYLLDRKDIISIIPKSPESVQLNLTTNQMMTIFIISVIFLPVCVIGLGIIVYYRRKK